MGKVGWPNITSKDMDTLLGGFELTDKHICRYGTEATGVGNSPILKAWVLP